LTINYLSGFMKDGPVILIAVAALFMVSCSVRNRQVAPSNDTVLYSDTIQYHPVRISRSDGLLFCNDFSGSAVESALYTSNWTGTMRLFEALQELDKDQSEVYKRAFNVFCEWMKSYPLLLQFQNIIS
jgi:hypothetical protein